jgi:hypothetical protein
MCASLAWLFTGSVGFHLVSMITAMFARPVQPYNIVLYICNHHIVFIHHTTEGNTTSRTPTDPDETDRQSTTKKRM